MQKSPFSNIIYWTLNDSRDHPGWVGRHQEPDFLSPEEMETYRGLLVPKRRDEWLLGRWTSKVLLRACDSEYGDQPLNTIMVKSEPQGAPFLFFDESGRYPGGLSISHRDMIAFCAITPGSRLKIGADIEFVEPRATVFVHDFFTAHEAEEVLKYQGRTRDTLVTMVWSMKESALKALGKGLRIDTRKVEISWDHDGDAIGSDDMLWKTARVRMDTEQDASFLCKWRIYEDYVLTLCAIYHQDVGVGSAGFSQVDLQVEHVHTGLI